MRIALKFAYNGKNFHGYARQPNVATIEGLIIDLLKETGYIRNPKEAKFQSASRTDKGVSALGNVVSFDTTKRIDAIFNDLNVYNNVVFYAIKKVNDDFYPRYATRRIYRYYLKKKDIEINAAMKTLSLFIGTYDFSNFARVESHKNPIRTIDAILVDESEDFIILDFFAQTYLWHQIRRIIATVLKVQEKRISDEMICNALQHPKKKVDFGLAKSEHLILLDVLYQFSFHESEPYLKKKDELELHLINDIKYPS
jgi:tRNA pseudouridine38-40 synthase